MLDYAEFSIAADGDVLIVTDEAGLRPGRPIDLALRGRAMRLSQGGRVVLAIDALPAPVATALSAAPQVRLFQLGDFFAISFDDIRRV